MSKKWLGTTFIIVLLILSALSLITMASLSFPKSQIVSKKGQSYFFLIRQALWLFLGGLGFLLTANLKYKKYKILVKYLYPIGAFALLIVLVAGSITNGAQRWLKISGFSLQPSEFTKIILVITLATIVDWLKGKNKIKRYPIRSTILIMGVTGIYALLIIFEKSFSSTAQIVIIGLTYLFVSGVRISMVTISTLLIGIAGWFGITKVGYRASRLASHTGSEIGFHSMQSLIAIGSGGFGGRFYGNGLQKYGFLPEIHTDYIFSGYAEETGFVGALFLLALYAALLIIMCITMRKIKDTYAKFLLIGIFMMFATQVVGNVMVVSNIIPSTGIPLPMMSYGGSTTIMSMMSLGIVYNIIRSLYKQEMGDSLDEISEIEYKM